MYRIPIQNSETKFFLKVSIQGFHIKNEMGKLSTGLTTQIIF